MLDPVLGIGNAAPAAQEVGIRHRISFEVDPGDIAIAVLSDVRTSKKYAAGVPRRCRVNFKESAACQFFQSFHGFLLTK